MKINTVLRCKEPEIKSRAYEVSDVITLSDAEFRSVLKEPLKDRGYLKGRTGQYSNNRQCWHWIYTVIKKLFSLVLGFLTKFLRLHIRGLFEYVGKMRLIEEPAFLRYERYRFVCWRKHGGGVSNADFFKIFHRRRIKNVFKVPEKIRRWHIYYLR